jgi:predicted Zn-dependent peptidase
MEIRGFLVESSIVVLVQDRSTHRTVLDNGIVVLVTENSAADIVAARIFLQAGSRWDTPDHSGLAHLVAAVMTKGTETLSSQDIAEQVESVGASLGTDASADYFLLGLKTVSCDFGEILALAAELLRSPTFPEDQVELERRLTLQGLHSRLEQPHTIASDQLRRAIYQHHPYAYPSAGRLETVAQLQRQNLQQFHKTHFRPDSMVISIAGRILPEDAVELVEQWFGSWQRPVNPLPALALPPVISNPQELLTEQDTQQAIVMLGYLAPAISMDPQKLQAYIATKLLATYLGNGLSSRLFVEMREKRGLAYDVSAFYPTYLDTSSFTVYMGTAPSNVELARTSLQAECDRLRTTPLTPDELHIVKNKLLGQYALGKQTSSQIAQIAGWYEVLGLGIEFDTIFQQQVADITADVLQETADRYLTTPYVSLVGPGLSLL